MMVPNPPSNITEPTPVETIITQPDGTVVEKVYTYDPNTTSIQIDSGYSQNNASLFFPGLALGFLLRKGHGLITMVIIITIIRGCMLMITIGMTIGATTGIIGIMAIGIIIGRTTMATSIGTRTTLSTGPLLEGVLTVGMVTRTVAAAVVGNVKILPK